MPARVNQRDELKPHLRIIDVDKKTILEMMLSDCTSMDDAHARSLRQDGVPKMAIRTLWIASRCMGGSQLTVFWSCSLVAWTSHGELAHSRSPGPV